MSLVVAINVPEGVVLAADSRVTTPKITDVPQQAPAQSIKVVEWITFDNATKLLSFDNHNYVGAVTFGVAEIGDRTANSFATEFLASIGSVKEDGTGRLTIKAFAKKLSDFYKKQWNKANNTQRAGVGNNMIFLVSGFNKKSPYAEVYEISIPDAPTPVLKTQNDFQILWGGQREIVDRIFNAIDANFQASIETALNLTPEQKQLVVTEQMKYGMPIVARMLALQDAVKLALTIIRTTIDLQSLSNSPRTVGGHIDIAVITKEEGLRFVQKKHINGEEGVKNGK